MDKGLPILLAPSDAADRWLCLREGFPKVETESPRGPGPEAAVEPVRNCETDNGFTVGTGGGAMALWPRNVLVERWLLLRPPSRESVEELRLERPAKTGTLVRLRTLKLLDSTGVVGLKSGELGLEVEGVGIDAVLEATLLVNERLGPGIR
jgi:hypothetical protein